MSSDEGVPLVTFEKAGVIPCPDTPLILLPLLPNEKKGQPPLHLLPGGQVSFIHARQRPGPCVQYVPSSP